MLYLIKTYLMCYVCLWVNQSTLHRRNHLLKVFTQSITAAHQGAFTLVKLRMAKADLSLLQAHQYIPGTMCHILKRAVNSLLASCCIKKIC